ncbi:hypothetical protein F5B20DRAFT_482405 [Whalleya microplaca]|nr:hypothetical protein F5B20DRAFT_482405 [Whalleya microplaca]
MRKELGSGLKATSKVTERSNNLPSLAYQLRLSSNLPVGLLDMTGEKAPDVDIYKEPPEHLLEILKAHIPHSLPLLRRLRFMRFAGGSTAHTHILFASEPPSYYAAEAPFTAAYLDFSRGPETEVWLYSSLERAATDPSAFHPDALQDGEETAVRALRTVKRLRDEYSEERREVPTVFAGTLSEALRRVLVGNRGFVVPYCEPYDKWVFQVDKLPVPDVPNASALADGMRWESVRRADIPFMLSRSKIPRKERTVTLLPSMALYREDGTPVAWCFLGPDSSLTSLHCEEEYRGRGFAKAVAAKLLREHLADYGDDGYCWADVAPDNLSSQGVCKSLGGKIASAVSWSRIDLDRSFPDQ